MLPLASSWEFVTTLDYEWSAIRGRRPYRWTIWVRNNAHSFRVSLPDQELLPCLPHSVDLFRYAHVYSHGCDSQPGGY